MSVEKKTLLAVVAACVPGWFMADVFDDQRIAVLAAALWGASVGAVFLWSLTQRTD